LTQVQPEGALGAVVVDRAEVVRALADTRAAVAIARGIAVGGLDLDHVGAEVGHDRGRDGPGDEACRVDDAYAGQQEVTHDRGPELYRAGAESQAPITSLGVNAPRAGAPARTRADRPARAPPRPR